MVNYFNTRGYFSGINLFNAFFAASLFFLVALAFPAITSAEPIEPEIKTVESVGYSAITGANTVLARDAAIDDALRKAVEQAVGSIVSSDTMVENYQILRDSVYTKTRGYVKGYAIVNENQTFDMYQVTVRATVATGDLKNDIDAIGLMQLKAERPRVLFMVAEHATSERGPVDGRYKYWWQPGGEGGRDAFHDAAASENTLKELFLNKGFNVVDASSAPARHEIPRPFMVPDVSIAAATEIGRGLNAEVVVRGKAAVKRGPPTGPGSRVGVYMADITVEAVRVDSGTVLASARGHGVARNISEVSGVSEALSKASLEAGDKLVGQILANWSVGNLIILRLNGVSDYKLVADFKNALKGQVRGIKAIYQRRFEGGAAVFELDTKVSTQNIADEISRLNGFNVHITGTTQNGIDAEIVPLMPPPTR